MRRRRGERSGKPYFRSERLFRANGLWFFATREGIDQGPFESRAAAERAIGRFVVEVAARDGQSRSGADTFPADGGEGTPASGCLARIRELTLEPRDGLG